MTKFFDKYPAEIQSAVPKILSLDEINKTESRYTRMQIKNQLYSIVKNCKKLSPENRRTMIERGTEWCNKKEQEIDKKMMF